MPRRRSPDLSLAATVLALSIGAGLAVGKSMRSKPRHPPDSAPGRTARRSHFGGYQVAGRTVTITIRSPLGPPLRPASPRPVRRML